MLELVTVHSQWYIDAFFITMVAGSIAGTFMQRNQVKFLYLNLGHFLDHLFMLVFASVAALRLNSEWGMSYAELIPYATPGFIPSRLHLSAIHPANMAQTPNATNPGVA